MSNHLNQKRICFVATLSSTLKAFVCSQAEFLVCNGWNVTFVCAEDSSFYKELPAGVRYIPLSFKRGIDLFGWLKAIISLYRLFICERFDIVQYSTPNAAFYTCIAAWLAQIPVRLYAQWGIRYVGFSGIVRKIFKLLECWCCKCSTIIEPDSLSNQEFSIQEGLYLKDKSRVIWNGSACGVNIERFDILKKETWRSEYRKKIGLESYHLVVGFVGSIRSEKGCNELIAASRSFFCDMPEARLLLVGDKQFYDTIDEELRDWVDSSIQVIVVAPNSEIPQYMACMDIFSLPSYREGFGLVIIEAEAMGIPVVVSDVPGPIDAMRHEQTGLIVPVKNSKALALALQTLLNDVDKRSAFGAAAMVYARDNFEQKMFLRYLLADKERLLKEPFEISIT
jgi:glycosyltransferase involved in cell wall biosynthesis